jgi:hypothetical protein
MSTPSTAGIPPHQLLRVYDVSDAVAVEVDASAETAWRALMSIDLIALGRRKPMVGALGAVRILPELILDLARGRSHPAPKSLTLRETATSDGSEGSWILLYESEHSLALGLVGKFWRPVIAYREVEADQFEDFDEPGYAKTIYLLSVSPLGPDRCQLRGEMRTATTDETARRWFRRYWTLGVGSGAHVLVSALLERAREIAERPDGV